MIAYDRINKNTIKVFINRKFVGKIKGTVGDGWRYYPNGGKYFGEKFNTVREVKKSLEQE